MFNQSPRREKWKELEKEYKERMAENFPDVTTDINH